MAVPFTRPQYVELARIIALIPSTSARRDTAAHFADELSKGSRAFDRDRFVAAANGKPSQARDVGIIDL